MRVIFKREDIRGMFDGDEVLCLKCMPRNIDELEEEEILVLPGDDDDLFFCDKCKKKILPA